MSNYQTDSSRRLIISPPSYHDTNFDIVRSYGPITTSARLTSTTNIVLVPALVKKLFVWQATSAAIKIRDGAAGSYLLGDASNAVDLADTSTLVIYDLGGIECPTALTIEISGTSLEVHVGYAT